MASAFDWGSDEVMMKNEHGVRFDRLYRVDATSYFPSIPQQFSLVHKMRKWSYAVLWDYQHWMDKQKFTWPVEHLGATQYTRLPEKTLLEEYDRRAGILSPPYDFKGSGLSRPRYRHAADLGCVLYTEKGELPAPCYNVPLAEIEDMSIPELMRLADWQRSALNEWSLTQQQVRQRMSDVVTGNVVYREPTGLESAYARAV
jgi:hypothetical protein